MPRDEGRVLETTADGSRKFGVTVRRGLQLQRMINCNCMGVRSAWSGKRRSACLE